MTTRYRTEGVNRHGVNGISWVPGGLEVRVASPLGDAGDPSATNPEQLIALAWATCLNATAQAIVAGLRRTNVRVEVELWDAVPGPGFEFHLDAYLSVEGVDSAEAERILAGADQRCPVSKLLREATTARVHTEPFTG